MHDPKSVCDPAHFKTGSEGGNATRKTLHFLRDRHPGNFMYSCGAVALSVDLWCLLGPLPTSRCNDYGFRNTVLRKKQVSQ